MSMNKTDFFFTSTTGDCEIHAARYEGINKKAIFQITHGMAEYIDRYEDFIEALVNDGFVVYAHDHIGHGKSINDNYPLGYFGLDNGEGNIFVKDCKKLTDIAKSENPGLPVFFFGHSMGSFYGRQYLCEHGSELDGAIIMGTGLEPLMTVKAGMMVCKLIASFKGWKYRSNLVNNMAFGAYNKRFEPARTRADWLTKDEKIVDYYINEPRCSFQFTLNGYYNMFSGIARLHDEKYLSAMPKDLPILFVSGQDDPVGSFGKEVEASVNSVKKVGCKNVEMKLYPNDRHEILNETDKEQVYLDLYNWLSNK